MNWQQVCENPYLQDIPFKIELNRLGQIIIQHDKLKQSLLIPEFPDYVEI